MAAAKKYIGSSKTVAPLAGDQTAAFRDGNITEKALLNAGVSPGTNHRCEDPDGTATQLFVYKSYVT